MKETTKAYVRRRKGDPFWNQVFKGRGIDIGSGDDPFKDEWFGTKVEPFDLEHGDANFLTRFRDMEAYDFVHSSNCLEHMPFPLHALCEWLAVLKPGGHLVFTIPDEDLYEQGVFPSKWNADHRQTFTIFKDKSWCSKSMNIVELLAKLPCCRIRRIEMADSNYDYSKMGTGVDQTFDAENGAEAFIEVVLQKTAPVIKERTFKHSGARGDLMYSLPTIAAMGGGTLYVSTDDTHYVGSGMDEEEVLQLCELLKLQPYIKDAKVHNGEKVDVDLDEFRDLSVDFNLLTRVHMIRFGANFDLSQPWISGVEKQTMADIVIHRSARYHGVFNWHELAAYQDRILFLGLPDEHAVFEEETGLTVKSHMAAGHMELAGIIAGAKLFIGNQSYPYSLAEAMKTPRVLEVCQHCPNCNPQDSNGHIHLSVELIESALEGCVIQSTYRMRQICQATPYASPPPEFPPKMWKQPKVSAVITATNDDNPNEVIDRKRAIKDFPGIEIFVLWMRDDEPPEAISDAIVAKPNTWITRKVNNVFEDATGDFLLLIESDCWIDDAGIQDMIHQFTDKKVGLVGQQMSLEGYPHIGRGILMMSRAAYEHCGFFSHHMRPKGWQGLELCLRLRELGYGNRQARSRNAEVCEADHYEGKGPARNANYIFRRYGVKV